MFSFLNKPKSVAAIFMGFGAVMLLFRLEAYHLDLFVIYASIAFLGMFLDTRKAYPLGASLILAGYEILNIFDLVGSPTAIHAYLSVGFLVIALLLFANMFKQYLGSGQESKYRVMEWGFLFLLFAVIGLLTNLKLGYEIWVLGLSLFLFQVIHYFLGNKQMKWIWLGVSFLVVLALEILTKAIIAHDAGNALLFLIPGGFLGVGLYLFFAKPKEV